MTSTARVALRYLERLAARPGSPLDIGERREAIIIDGLYKLAKKFGVELGDPRPLRIDSRGELPFWLKQTNARSDDPADVVRFPLALVKLMNSTGLPKFKYVHDMSNGVTANHFDWEKLLYKAGINIPELNAINEEQQRSLGYRSASDARDLADRGIGPWKVKLERSKAGTAVLRATKSMFPPITMVGGGEPQTPTLASRDEEWRLDGFANRLYLALLELGGPTTLSGGVRAELGLSFKPDMDPRAVGVQGKPLHIFPWVDLDPPPTSLTEGDLKKLDQAAQKLQASAASVVKTFRDKNAPIWGVTLKAKV